MTDEYKWENPNSKLVEYGGPALGGVLIWIGILFYPAVVIGIHVGLPSQKYGGWFDWTQKVYNWREK